MLSTIETREVTTGGVLASTHFTIKANGKAFKVLIDGLYSDKIRAVVRELWTNAHDSHIAAGCTERPFDCQLPTIWDPVFRVRDYGVSLSHDDVMHLYTTVFESTKDGTNTQVGKLGLGSKSPFAYSDTFTVTAWLAGEKRTYSAYIGSDGVPMIALMGTEETSEENGLEVSFPVKSDDVSAFLTAAQRIAYGFDTQPNITSGQTLLAEMPAVVMDDLPLWKLVKGYMGFRTPGAVAKQGCVLYPIDPNAIPNINDEQRAVLSSPFVIEFPIGDLEISASRESLGYDARTCKNILRVADIIAVDIRKRYEDKINGASTYWEALVAYSALHNSELDGSIKKILAKGMSWRGRELVQYFNMSPLLEKAGEKGVTEGGVSASKIEYRRANKLKNLKWEAYKHWQLNVGKTVIYFEDVAVPAGRVGDRIKYHRECNPQFGQHDVVWFKASAKSWAWKRLYAKLGRPPLIDAATLPKPPASSKSYRSKNKVPMRSMAPGFSSFAETTILESDRIVYVQMERGDLNECGLSTYDVKTIAANLRALGYMGPDEHVIAVPATHKRMIARNPHWVHLRALAEQALEKFVIAVAARADTYQEALDASERGIALVRAMVGADEKFATSKGPAGRLLTRYQEIADKMAPGSALQTQLTLRRLAVCLCRNTTGPAFSRKDPIEKWVKAFDEAYPLLQDIERSYEGAFNDDTRKRVISYVNLIDASQSASQSAAA